MEILCCERRTAGEFPLADEPDHGLHERHSEIFLADELYRLDVAGADEFFHDRPRHELGFPAGHRDHQPVRRVHRPDQWRGVLPAGVSLMAFAAELQRRLVVVLAEDGGQVGLGTEAGFFGDLRHGQIRFGDQLPRAIQLEPAQFLGGSAVEYFI